MKVFRILLEYLFEIKIIQKRIHYKVVIYV